MKVVQERRGGKLIGESLITQMSVRLMVPFIQLFGLYVIAHGHYSPGGGFQGGVALGASFILYALVFGLDASFGRFSERANAIVVFDRSISPGAAGPLVTDVCMALARSSVRTYGVIAGLGGRPITKASLYSALKCACHGSLAPLTYLDLNEAVIRREAIEAEAERELVL